MLTINYYRKLIEQGWLAAVYQNIIKQNSRFLIILIEKGNNRKENFLSTKECSKIEKTKNYAWSTLKQRKQLSWTHIRLIRGLMRQTFLRAQAQLTISNRRGSAPVGA